MNILVICIIHIFLCMYSKLYKISYLTGLILILVWLRHQKVGNINITGVSFYVYFYILGVIITYCSSYFFNFQRINIIYSLINFNMKFKNILMIMAEEIIWRGIIQVYLFICIKFVITNCILSVLITVFICSVIFVLVHKNIDNFKIALDMIVFTFIMGTVTLICGNLMWGFCMHLGRNIYINNLVKKFHISEGVD